MPDPAQYVCGLCRALVVHDSYAWVHLIPTDECEGPLGLAVLVGK